MGNYYCQGHADAWATLELFTARQRELERRTQLFVERFCGSDLSLVVKEASLFNLSTPWDPDLFPHLRWLPFRLGGLSG